MLKNGALQCRKHPKNPKRNQFKFERQKKKHTIKSVESLAMRSKQDLEPDRAALAGNKMSAIQQMVSTSSNRVEKLGLRRLLREQDDEDDAPEPAKKKPAKHFLKPEPAATEAEEELDVDVSKLLKEASKAKTLETELKMQLEEFKGSVYATKTKARSFQETLEKLQSAQQKLDPRRLSKQSDRNLKIVADEVAQALQSAKGHISEIKKLKKLESGSTKAYSSKEKKK
jgi:hypothetical protein